MAATRHDCAQSVALEVTLRHKGILSKPQGDERKAVAALECPYCLGPFPFQRTCEEMMAEFERAVEAKRNGTVYVPGPTAVLAAEAAKLNESDASGCSCGKYASKLPCGHYVHAGCYCTAWAHHQRACPVCTKNPAGS